MPDKHAVLAPSAAHRWLMCPPSARLEEQFPAVTSPYAREGTEAHSLCEKKLRQLLGQEVDFGDVDPEMEKYADMYRDFVEEEWNAAKAITPDAHLFIEQQLNFDKYVPESFGTSDAVIVSDDTLTVIDFKYGQGVFVDAVGNPQLRLYALGAYLALCALFNFTKIKAIVFQPRLNNIDSEELTVDELLKWAEEVVKPTAKLAFNGEGEFEVGAWCRFCKAGAVCKARAKSVFPIVTRKKENPAVIPDDEIPALLDKLDETESWIADLRTYAQNKAISEGYKWTGYTLVESRTQPKIQDQVGALNALNAAGYSTEDVTNTKLKGLTDLERLLTKPMFNTILGGFITKPHGSPTLVKITDKRPEISPVELAFKEE